MFSELADSKIIYLNDRHEEKDTEKESRQRLHDKRILALLSKGDIAIFGEIIDSFLLDYYRNLGLAAINNDDIFYVPNYRRYTSLTEALIYDRLVCKEIRKKGPKTLFPYIVSKNTQILAKKIKSSLLTDYKIVEKVNNKTNYRMLMEKLGFPTIPGFGVNNLKDAKLRFHYLKNLGFQSLVIKKDRSVSGFGVFVIRTEKELENYFKRFFVKDKSFLLEGFIKGVKASPNIQYWIGGKEISFIGLSDQSFEKGRFIHNGNIFPSQLAGIPLVLEEVKRLSWKFCRYLQNKKCHGLIGIDYIITKDNAIYSTEVNFRLNYSTFPALIAKRLFSSTRGIFWDAFTMKSRPVSFKKLFYNARKLFIIRRKEYGVFPIDIGLLGTKGEGQFMVIAPTAEEADNYKNRLRQTYENMF
jgi:hypothetical protein